MFSHFILNSESFSFNLFILYCYITFVIYLLGELIWQQAKGRLESNTTKLYNRNDIFYKEFPVIIPDCNSDSVNEMALVQHINNMPTLAIVSGKTGKKMINSINNDNCTEMTNLMLNYDMSLVYYCRKNSRAGMCIFIGSK